MWVKLPNTFAENPKLEEAGAEAFAVHVAGMCYCARQGTDGEIARPAARRLWSVPDIDDAINRLVKGGLWAEVDGHYEIVDYLKDQPSKADMDKVQDLWRVRQRRSRQHKLGDHSLCNPRYCDKAAQTPVTRDDTGDSPVSHDTTLRTVSSRNDPQGVESKRRGGGSSARPGGLAPHPAQGGETTDKPTCPSCGKTWPLARVMDGSIPPDLICRDCKAKNAPTKTGAGWQAVLQIAAELGVDPEYVDADLTDGGDEITAEKAQGGLAFVSYASNTDIGVWIYCEGLQDDSTWPENEPVPTVRFHNRAFAESASGNRKYYPADALTMAKYWNAQTKDRT